MGVEEDFHLIRDAEGFGQIGGPLIEIFGHDDFTFKEVEFSFVLGRFKAGEAGHRSSGLADDDVFALFDHLFDNGGQVGLGIADIVAIHALNIVWSGLVCQCHVAGVISHPPGGERFHRPIDIPPEIR